MALGMTPIKRQNRAVNQAQNPPAMAIGKRAGVARIFSR